MTFVTAPGSHGAATSARIDALVHKFQGPKYGAVDRDLILTGVYARDAIQSANLTHYWKFDEEDTSTAYDYTAGNAYDLTGTSISSFVDGVVGSAVDLDGTADYFSTTTLTDFADDTTGTFSIWFNLDLPLATTGNQALIVCSDSDSNDSTRLYVRANDTGSIRISCKSGGTTHWQADTNLIDFNKAINNWTHVVFGSDGVEPFVYVNGVKSSLTFSTSTDKTKWLKQVITDAASNNADNLSIGVWQNNSGLSNIFNGQIDEVMYWNTALSAEEVRRLYASYNPERIAGLDNTPSQGVDLGEGLKLYYDFDGDRNIAPATILDKSGWGNHATSSGSMTSADWVDGKYGSCLDFDGTDDYISISDIGFMANDTTGTISAWVKSDGSTTGNQTLLAISDADTSENTYLVLYFNRTNNYLRVKLRNDATNKFDGHTDSSTLLDNIWNHIAITQNGTSPKLYINGVESVISSWDVSADLTQWISALTSATNVASDLSVGARLDNSSATEFFDGKIDEFRYYGRALTAEEVWNLYNSSKPPQANMSNVSLRDGLTGYWSFDEYVVTTYTSAYDYASNNTPITLTHASAPAVVQGKYGIAPHYDGSADYTSATITSADWANDTQGTISLWFNLDDDISANEGVLTISDANTNNQTYLWVYLADGVDYMYIRLNIDGTEQWSIRSTTDTNWASYIGNYMHICIIQDGVAPKLYINGVEDTINVTSTDLTKWINDLTSATNVADTLTVGAYSNNSSQESFFDGKVDDVRIYSRPLSAKEVWNLYKGRLQ